MKLQKLLSYVRRAVSDYDMIDDNDRIAVGISGGKDSLSLLIALSELRRFYPKKFEVEAVSVSVGFEGMDFSPVQELCDKLNIRYTIVETDIAQVVFENRKEKNPCSLCAKMRKGALNDAAVNLGCNKIALGHNRDDIIETFFMSLFYEARIHTFAPVTYLDRKKVHSIRPLMYVPENHIRTFVENEGVLVVKSTCPVDGNTRREDTKKFVKEQCEKYDHFEEKIFGAVKRSYISGWAVK